MNSNISDIDKTVCSNIKDLFNKKISSFEYISSSRNDTENIATMFAKYLKKSDIVVLSGELGSGKTTFVTSIAKVFGVENDVSSPTFTIVNEYLSNKHIPAIYIYHFDVYRIKDSNDFIDSIGTEYFSNGICLIEWGENIKDILPKNTIYISFSKDLKNENTRYLKFSRGDLA